MYFEIEKHLPGFSDTISVFDEDGDLIYEVDSRLILNKRIIRVYDANDALISIVERKESIVEPSFNIFVHGKLVGELVKEFTFFEPRFHIISDFGPIIAKGNLIDLDFKLLDSEGDILAIVSDSLSDEEDNYGVEMDEEIEMAFMIALLITIDVQLNE